MSDRQSNNMVEIKLHDHVVVVTDSGEQQVTLGQFAEMVNRGDNVDKIQLKVDLSCQG